MSLINDSLMNAKKEGIPRVNDILDILTNTGQETSGNGSTGEKRFFWDDTEHMDVVVEYPRYYVRGLPFRTTKRVRKDTAFSFLKESLAGSLGSWAKSMERLVGKLSETFLVFVGKHAIPEIQKTIAQCEIKIRGRFAEFHKTFINELIRKDQIAFRQGLHKQMKDRSSEIFGRRLREHIGALVLKVHQEVGSTQIGSKEASLVSGYDPIPHGARFIFKKDSYSVYILEQEPQMRTVTFTTQKDKLGSRTTYRLAMPYVVFVATLYGGAPVSLHLFFRNTPLHSSSDDLYCPALSNISEKNFAVCFPMPGKRDSQQKTVEDMIHNFWGSEFYINDLASCFISAQSSFPQLSSLSAWEENSKRNPQFPLSISWQKARFSVSGIVEKSIELANEKLGIKPYSSKLFDPRSIESYVDAMAAKLGEEIQEACFFLTQHTHIDTGLLAESQNAFKKLCDESGAHFVETLGSVSKNVFSEKELVRIAGDVLAEARALQAESNEDMFVRTVEKRMKEIITMTREAGDA